MVDEILEMNKYYSGTVIGKRGKKGEIIPLQFRSIEKNKDDTYSIRTKNVQGVKTFEEVFDKSKYILNTPRLGMINYNKYVVYASRSSQRQWRKGITNDNFSVENYVNVFMPNYFDDTFNKMSLNFFRQLYNNKFYSPDESIELIRKGSRLGCAICRSFSIALNAESGDLILLYKTYGDVGKINDKNEVVLYEPFLFLRESVSKYLNCN